jgi:predicted SAM-dependent methyltransferase
VSARRVIIGAGEQRWPGWVPTQQTDLDLLDPASFAAYFGDARADALLCEHVWEHLEPADAVAAARLVSAYLKPGGYLRVAVPDGHHPDPGYRSLVAVRGPGPAHDHRVLYTLETLGAVFTQADFVVRPLEWWDAAGAFHHVAWRVEDGPVYRSRQLDHRNAGWREGHGAPGFTSVILDAVKPAEPALVGAPSRVPCRTPAGH